MDKNQPYFDPYNFSNNVQMPNVANIPNVQTNQPDIDMMQQALSPAMYYEQQYMYYKYLTQMVEYKLKLKELERSSKDSNNGK